MVMYGTIVLCRPGAAARHLISTFRYDAMTVFIVAREAGI